MVMLDTDRVGCNAVWTEPEFAGQFERLAWPLRLPAGALAFRPGDACTRFVFVTQGRLRVQLVAETGREIVLYRVGPGDVCAVTVGCLLQSHAYDVEGVVEADLAALTVDRATFSRMMAASHAFRERVLLSQTGRLLDVIALLHDQASRPLAARLAERLVLLADGAGSVHATHQALAAELGTAREVISRHLKRLEARGLLTTDRGHIALTDRAGLQALAAERG